MLLKTMSQKNSNSNLIYLPRIDPAIHFCVNARIRDKRGLLISPKPNIFQLRMLAAYRYCIKNKIPPRLFGLKPRQVGGSTVGASILYHHVRNFLARAMTIADTNLKSDRLWEMVKLLAEHDTYNWGDTWSAANNELYFAHGSEVVKRSAEAPRQARGDTFMAALLSEVSWWRATGKLSADETAVSLINALADHEDTLGIIDTTPAGKRGFSWETWRDARWFQHKGEEDNLFLYWKQYTAESRQQKSSMESNNWFRVFAAWWEFKEHTKKVTPEEIKDLKDTIDEREIRGIQRYNWSWEQIAWRRFCIKNKCRNSIRRMDEEYPEDPDSCWIASGGAVFDSAGLSRVDIMARSARPQAGTITRARAKSKTSFHYQDDGWAIIFEPPIPGARYVIGVDPMRGERDMQSQGDRDHHAVQVWRKDFFTPSKVLYQKRLVARIRTPCQIDNSILADRIDLLSRYYGGATVAVETNMGFAVLAKLRDDYNTNLYIREEYDRLTETTNKILGIVTSSKTRQLMLDHLIDGIREQSLDIECPELVRQMAIFETGDDGVPRAPKGDHDDEVLAAAIALTAMDQASIYSEETVRYTSAPDENRWIEY